VAPLRERAEGNEHAGKADDRDEMHEHVEHLGRFDAYGVRAR
jgi:hypothetical protein